MKFVYDEILNAIFGLTSVCSNSSTAFDFAFSDIMDPPLKINKIIEIRNASSYKWPGKKINWRMYLQNQQRKVAMNIQVTFKMLKLTMFILLQKGWKVLQPQKVIPI